MPTGLFDFYKQNVSPEKRFYLEGMFGNKEKPFTAQNLTQDELNMFTQAIQNSRNRLVGRNSAIMDAMSYSDLPRDVQEKFNVSRYLPEDFFAPTPFKDGPIDEKQFYEDRAKRKQMYQEASNKSLLDAKQFAEKTNKDLSAGYGYVNYDDYQGLPKNMQYVLGRFQYQILPDGQIKIKDRYEFSNEHNKAFTERAKDLSVLEKVGILSKEAMQGLREKQWLDVPWYQPMADVLGGMTMGKGTPVDIQYMPQTNIDITGLEPSIK